MKAGRFLGIDLHIHWSFWLLIFFAILSSNGYRQGLASVLMVMSVFLCVVLHEYGHALAARRYGIRTRDITLMPIGGVARLERMPEEPKQEFVVAIAGPLVNLVIAGLLFILLRLDLAFGETTPMLQSGSNFLDQLMQINIFLVVFNMLPAFPMDGGRILRSLLAIKFSYLRATEIAARVGRWMALLFAIYAVVSWNPLLLILAGFVFLTGMTELFQVRMREALRRNAGPTAGWNDDDQDQPPGDGQIIDAVDFRQLR
jgi:Zn-dependent protease